MASTDIKPAFAYKVFRVDALPSSGILGVEFIRSIGKHAFALLYDLMEGRTYICIEAEPEWMPKTLLNGLHGLEVSDASLPKSAFGVAQMLSIYKSAAVASDLIRQIVSEYSGRNCAIALLFEPESEDRIGKFKSEVEGILSNRVVRSTSSLFGTRFGNRSNTSSQTEVYDKSEENLLLKNLLEDMDNSILSGDGAYKVMMSAINDDRDEVYNFIKDRAIVLSRTNCPSTNMEMLFRHLHDANSLLLGIGHASAFLGFYGNTKVNYTIPSLPPYSGGDITVGTYLSEGVSDTHMEIKLAESSLNLGVVITGLPGSGKTSLAMSIIDKILNAHSHGEKPKLLVMSSTSEWDRFAVAHSLHLIRLYKDRIPINFFSCGYASDKVQFYEDLSVLLANAAKAGPYRNPMEKCFLNAFRRIYKDTCSPDPTEVYDAVEESIVKLHGKRTNVGVKYTKHGENIRSALENMRSILERAEFSSADGVSFGRVLSAGVVFDVSRVSNSAKPYIYSMILNQAYAEANELDEDGDGSLRFIICIEESQILFDSSSKEDTAATEDLSKRIQDFRKKGIALVLITHNAIDIPPQIRRICQNKIYMKQASDTAIIAARDLVFSNAEPDSVVLKLKHMNSRVAAIDYVAKHGDEKLSGDSLFIRTIDYVQPSIPESAIDSYESRRLKFDEMRNCEVEIIFEQCGEAQQNMRIKAEGLSRAQIESLGEVIAESEISNNRCAFGELVLGRRYTLNLLNGKGKAVAKYDIRANQTVSVCI